MTDAARNTKDLPRLVGYAELAKVYGWQKRSLQRAVSAGKLRRPMIVAGGRAAWYDTDIKDYLARLGGELEALAVSDPEKLTPEQAGEAAISLAARYISDELGQNISASDVVLGLLRPRSPDDNATEFIDSWVAFWLELERKFSQFDDVKSMAIAYGLFPALRPGMSQVVPALEKLGCTPIEFALVALAGPEGFDPLMAWLGRKMKSKTRVS